MTDTTETTETPEPRLAAVVSLQAKKRTRDKLVCQKEDGEGYICGCPSYFVFDDGEIECISCGTTFGDGYEDEE